jgi:membrane fusion protein (multidrug efflux system)
MTVPLRVPPQHHEIPAPPRDGLTPMPPPAPHAGAPDPHASHGGPDLGFVVPPPAQLTRTRAFAMGAVALVVLGGAFVLRWLPMRHAHEALAAETKEGGVAIARVQIVSPVVISSDKAISLPGSVQPLEETVVYPRASGYIRKWYFDLGDKVREGDVLAEIDTPDLDQQQAQARAQLAQAEAGLEQARANARFSKENLERYRQLLPAGLASQQDFDKAKAQAELDQASIGVADATIGSQRANLQYLGQLKIFAKVTAPFAGTVTLRSIERGMLMTAGTATPLFRISAMDPVRVFVQVPQDVAPSVRVDLTAGVTIREFPDSKFEGKIAHAAGSLDPTTRTMMTEVRVPNPKGEILTGMYAQVSLTLPTPHKVLSVPGTALLNGAGGLRVAVVDATGHVHLAPVIVERDTGPNIEISSGLAPGDRVVKIPSADLTEGRAVEVAP